MILKSSTRHIVRITVTKLVSNLDRSAFRRLNLIDATDSALIFRKSFRCKPLQSNPDRNLIKIFLLGCCSPILGDSPEISLQNLGVSNLSGKTERDKKENLKSLANLGKEAHCYHNKILILDKAFRNSIFGKSLTAEQLVKLANEAPRIEANFYQNKVRLFPLARQSSEHKNDNTKRNLLVAKYSMGC